jgi:hypothetical protein
LDGRSLISGHDHVIIGGHVTSTNGAAPPEAVHEGISGGNVPHPNMAIFSSWRVRERAAGQKEEGRGKRGEGRGRG